MISWQNGKTNNGTCKGVNLGILFQNSDYDALRAVFGYCNLYDGQSVSGRYLNFAINLDPLSQGFGIQPLLNPAKGQYC